LKKLRIAFFALVLFSFPLFGQLELVTSLALKISEPIEIDGNLSEPAWGRALDASELMQFKPEEGVRDPLNTVVKILYDNNFVYFAFQCFDPEPDQIVARVTDKDKDLRNDDSVYVLMDMRKDKEHFYYLGTNLNGVLLDGRITLDGQMADVGWDGAWRTASQKTDYGWSVEMAVDLSTFDYDPKENISMGLSFSRIVARSPKSIFWEGPLDPAFQVSLLGEMDEVDFLKEIKRLKISPHALAVTETGADSWIEWGLDVPWALSQTVSAHLALNPDFATVEPDKEQINLTRFELFLPEKRDYFREGSATYDQPIRLFYSKRIPDIYGGINFGGRSGGLEFSAMNVYARKDDFTGDDPANFSMLRLRKKMMRSSFVGILAANKLIDGDNFGTAGIDALFQLNRNLSLTGQFAASYGEYSQDNLAYFLRPSYDSDNFHFHLGYFHLGESFGDNVNKVGFIPDDNRREIDSGLGITFLRNKGALSKASYLSNYNVYWGMDGTRRSWQIDQGFSVELKSKFSFMARHTQEFKAWDGVLFEKDFRNDLTKLMVGFNMKEYDFASFAYSRGHNFGWKFDMLEVGKNLHLSKNVAVEFEMARIFFYGSSPRNQFVMMLKGYFNFSEDFYSKILFQTNTLVDVEKSNLEFILTYRIFRPAGYVHFVYQAGRSSFGVRPPEGSKVFLKLNYAF
jgi:hypothetical protein